MSTAAVMTSAEERVEARLKAKHESELEALREQNKKLKQELLVSKRNLENMLQWKHTQVRRVTVPTRTLFFRQICRFLFKIWLVCMKLPTNFVYRAMNTKVWRRRKNGKTN